MQDLEGGGSLKGGLGRPRRLCKEVAKKHFCMKPWPQRGVAHVKMFAPPLTSHLPFTFCSADKRARDAGGDDAGSGAGDSSGDLCLAPKPAGPVPAQTSSGVPVTAG